MRKALANPERFTPPLMRAEYDRLVMQGELIDQKVELIRGRIVEMSPQGTLHAWVIKQLTMQLAAPLQGHAVVQVQCPLALSDDSEPEPDVAVIAPGDYRDAHPTTALLVIEVAETSLDTDRRVKAPLYAEAGIPEYWIVNVADHCVDIYREPHAGSYQHVETCTNADTLRPIELPNIDITVADIF